MDNLDKLYTSICTALLKLIWTETEPKHNLVTYIVKHIQQT